MDSPSKETSGPIGTLWQRRVVQPVVQQLTQGITPEKIAVTLAVGTACAFFPILGTTTILCLVVGVVLRLNQPLIQLVNALCTIPHLFVIYGLFRLGGFFYGVTPVHSNAHEFIMKAPHQHFSVLMLVGLFSHAHQPFWRRFELEALHAIVAWATLAPFWIALVYWSSLPMLRGALRAQAQKAHPVP